MIFSIALTFRYLTAQNASLELYHAHTTGHTFNVGRFLSALLLGSKHNPNNILKLSEHSAAILMAVNQTSHSGGKRPKEGASL
jgi:hypothetical protein